LRLRVGLTGGIGSGKTTVSDRFRELDVTVIDADELAHTLSKRGEQAYSAIVDTFGPEILQDDDELDRARLRDIVFNNPEKRKLLEDILHPKIRREMTQQASASASDYCVLVIPLLIEKNLHEIVDRILVVDAPDKKRIEWIKARSGLSEEEIQLIFSSQASRQQRLETADDVIENTGTIEHLIEQADRLHKKYLDLVKYG